MSSPNKFSDDELFEFVDGLLDTGRVEQLESAMRDDEELAAKISVIRYLVNAFEDGEDSPKFPETVSIAGNAVRKPSDRRRRVVMQLGSVALAVAASILIFATLSQLGGGIQLQDGSHVVAFADGELKGFGAQPGKWISQAQSALVDGHVVEPPALVAVRSGSRSANVTYPGVLGPLDIPVMSERPILKWKQVPGADRYYVNIFASGSSKPVKYGPIVERQWQPPTPFERGKVFTWEVIAEIGDQEYFMPPSPPLPSFKIISEESLQQVLDAEALVRDSPLLLTMVYLEAGLIERAEEQLVILAADNPDSSLINSLLQDVRRMQSRTN